METKHFRTLDGKEYAIRCATPRGATSHYCLALHKSGSVLFDNVVAALCQNADRPAVAFEPLAFKQGIVPTQFGPDALEFLNAPGFVFFGFRGPWRLEGSARFRAARKLLLVRDPRDIAVSFYHSQRSSHYVPEKGLAREGQLAMREKAKAAEPSEFVLRGHMNFILANYEYYAALCAKLPEWSVYRYEDIIYKKRDWVADVAARLEISLSEDMIAGIASKQDVFPATEDTSKHIRRVHPGGWREVLNDAALEHIAQRCVKASAYFGYQLGASG